MKVLIVFPYTHGYRTGITSAVDNLSQSLEKKNCDVRIIRFTNEKSSKETNSKNDLLIHKDKNGLLSWYRLASEVKREAANGKYDVVHGQGCISVLYKILGSKIPACITNHGIGYKIDNSYWSYKLLKDYHDFLPYLKYFPQKSFEIMAGKLLYNKANRITTVSNFCKREVSEIYGVPEERIDVIPNGVRIDFFKQCSKNEKDKIMEQYNFEKALLFIKPIPRKGLHLLIRALPAILKEVPGLKLLVVGGISTNATYYKFCYNLSQRFHVKDRVLFIGWVDDVDLPKYFTVASALVLPSLYEASPITVLESMACGTPVCASKGLGLSEIITDGKDGFLVDPTNATSLAEALITLLTDNSLRQRMSFNTRKKIERHYSWDYIAEQYLRAYNKTINFELKPVF